MSHADAFLQDIIAPPHDDAPRLIYADWLLDQDDAGGRARRTRPGSIWPPIASATLAFSHFRNRRT